MLPEADKPYSLSELTGEVRSALKNDFPDTYWVQAETSDVHINKTSGHCYLEFIEKDAKTNLIIAKARGVVWAKTFCMLKPYFEMETGQHFASGLKVLVKVNIEFHEIYGFSLNVIDIDPTYTLGDLVRKRQEIIRQLQEEGVFTLNKELPFPLLPQRIAVITSPTAAGYEDFLDQLLHNKAGYPFYVKLFQALMQGEKTEQSIIAALERIDIHRELFDVVTIIRGGGATSDLNSFDSYLLAANCAQFPLPIITGIGHERDDTIIDLVAHTRLKTPTAVASFLVNCMDQSANQLNLLQQTLCSEALAVLVEKKQFLQQISTFLPTIVSSRIERNRSALNLSASKLPIITSSLLDQKKNLLEFIRQRIPAAINSRLIKESRFLELQEQFIRMASPDYILKRGYCLTLHDGKILKSATEVKTGEHIITRFSDGEIESKVLKKIQKHP